MQIVTNIDDNFDLVTSGIALHDVPVEVYSTKAKTDYVSTAGIVEYQV